MASKINLIGGCPENECSRERLRVYAQANREAKTVFGQYPHQIMDHSAGFSEHLLATLSPGHIVEFGACLGGRYDAKKLTGRGNTSVIVDCDDGVLDDSNGDCRVQFDAAMLPSDAGHLDFLGAIVKYEAIVKDPLLSQLKALRQFLETRPVSAVFLSHILIYLPKNAASRLVRMTLESLPVGGKAVIGNLRKYDVACPPDSTNGIPDSDEWLRSSVKKFAVDDVHLVQQVPLHAYDELIRLRNTSFRLRLNELLRTEVIKVLPMTRQQLEQADDEPCDGTHFLNTRDVERVRVLTRES